MKKILGIFILCMFLVQSYSYAGLLDKEFVLYMPNRSKTTVKVNIFTDKVTHFFYDGKWVEVPEHLKVYYDRLYQKQKEKQKRKEKEKKEEEKW